MTIELINDYLNSIETASYDESPSGDSSMTQYYLALNKKGIESINA